MQKPTTYYLAENHDSTTFNAAVLRKDNEVIMDEEGFIAIQFKHYKKGSALIKLQRIVNAFTIGFSIKKNSLVVFHFPFLATAYQLVLKILKWRSIKTVALIIDIDGLRDKDTDLFKSEINSLSKFNFIIAHNKAMQFKLLEFIPSAKIFTIGLFDYPIKATINQHPFSTTICFAGNISKALFVYQLYKIEGLQFNIYGAGYDKNLNNNNSFNYQGVVQPADLPHTIQASFGLVWDGDSIENCDAYLSYNNPHKLSLYLAAELPVIVWKHSAVADFIETNHLGFTVNSLHEIHAKISSITLDEYAIMKQQVAFIGNQFSNGFYLRKVLSAIVEAQ